MSKPPVSRAEEEAAAWFARMRRPDAAAHRASFEAWRRDPANAAAYRQAEEDWLMVGGVAAAHIGAHPPKSASSPAAAPQWAIAAMLFLAFALGLGWYWQTDPGAPQYAETISAPGTTRLADGTEVVLSDGATIVVAFEGAARKVTLTGGRARFIVAPDATRPFTVLAAGSATTAIGTVFEVDLRTAQPRIHLIEGVVEVRGTRGARALRLAPGESAEVDGSEPRRLSVSAKPSPSTRIDVENLQLGTVIERANRANKVSITLADPALATRRVTGSFDLADGSALARKLAAALDLDLVATSDTLVLRSRAKKPGG